MKRKLTAIIVAATMSISAFSFSAIAVENTDTKPYDFNRVLYEETFDGDKAVDSQLAYGRVIADIANGDTTVTSTKEQGDYASITRDDGGVSKGSYFGIAFGADSGGPIDQLQCPLSELGRAQVSFDFCPVEMGDKSLVLQFYDKYSDTTAAKSANLITFKTDGTISFLKSKTTVNYTTKTWMSFDVFFDFDADKYTVYIDGNKVVGDVVLEGLNTCVESVRLFVNPSQEAYTVYMDNFRIAIPKEFGIEKSTPSAGENAALSDSITVELSNMPTSFPEDAVTLTSVPEGAVYSVSCENNTATIAIEGGMQYETAYTVTVSDALVDIYGQPMSDKNSITITTMSEPDPDIPVDPEEPEIPEPEIPEPEIPEAPQMPTPYNRELFFEDFNGDTSFNSQLNISNRDGFTRTIESGDEEVISKKDQGDYAHLSKDDTSNDIYFRVKYGDGEAPVQSQCDISELGRMQVSFDICPVVLGDKALNMFFYDRYSVAETITETLIVFKTDGTITFANTSVKKDYSLKTWMSFDIFLDFETDTYSVYLDGEEVFKDVVLKKLNACVESMGLVITTTTTPWSIYMDNMRIAIPKKLYVESSTPADSSELVNVADDITINLTNDIVDFQPEMVTVLADGTEAECDISEENGVVTISFEDGMDFETPYTVTLDGEMTDIYGQKLGEDKTISFSTEMSKISSSIPKFTDKVSAKVVNPASATTAALVVVVRDADGSVTIHPDEKEVPAQSTTHFEVDFDYKSLTEGQSVYAFVADGVVSGNLLRDVVASPDKIYASDSKNVSASLDKADLVGDTLFIEGKLTAEIEKNIILKIITQENTPAYILPLQSDENGKFSLEISADDIPYGIHFVSVTGFGMAESNKKKIVRMTNEEKEAILTAVNGANNSTQVKTVMEDEAYKEKINLPAEICVENTYTTLFEQLPFETYDNMIETAYQADSLLKKINDSDWSEYTQLFDDYGHIILKGAQQILKYNDCDSNKKNEINKLIKLETSFSSFVVFRVSFDNAVIEKTTVKEEGSSGGSGGGGGGGNVPFEKFEMETVAPPQENEEPAKNIFKDMQEVAWAKDSVMKLCDMGIVSAADNYRPYDNITREEFIKMLVVLSGVEITAGDNFTDVSGDEWFAPYLSTAKKAGFVNGIEGGAFGVGRNITRQDMAVMAYRVASVMSKNLKGSVAEVYFTDYNSISGYAKDAIGALQKAGVISGMGDGSFMPQGVANRAQAAVIICNLIKAME